MAQEYIEDIEAEADTSFEQIIEQSTHREDLLLVLSEGSTNDPSHLSV